MDGAALPCPTRSQSEVVLRHAESSSCGSRPRVNDGQRRAGAEVQRGSQFEESAPARAWRCGRRGDARPGRFSA